MRIVHFEKSGVPGIAADDGSGRHGLTAGERGFPGTLPELIAQGVSNHVSQAFARKGGGNSRKPLTGKGISEVGGPADERRFNFHRPPPI